MYVFRSPIRVQRMRSRAFSLPELLIVIGIIALLLAIIVSPLRDAHRQAMRTRCASHLQQLGIGLETAVTEFNYYPLWDDAGTPMRYTWVDVLVEQGLLPNVDAAYCPDDPRPSEINSARARQHNVLYPGAGARFGIDYSYGIGVPLATGNWNASSFTGSTELRRHLENPNRNTSVRVLAGDANWSAIYNLSGDFLATGDWSFPTQYDNTVAWRHPGFASNLLFQDGHVARVRYDVNKPEQPINTSLACLWYPSEELHVGPEYLVSGMPYPSLPAHRLQIISQLRPIPELMVPAYYTQNLLWTQIRHK